MDAARGPSFAADQDEGSQRGSRRPIPPLVPKIQVTTTNEEARAQGGLTPDFLALSNIDVILQAMAPERREAFLKSRNRLKQFDENDEILALAHYLDTVVVMVDGLTKNVAAAMTAHTEPMANLTAQLKRVEAELPSQANALTPRTIRRWLACWAASILLVAPAAFFWGCISAQREQARTI